MHAAAGEAEQRRGPSRAGDVADSPVEQIARRRVVVIRSAEAGGEAIRAALAAVGMDCELIRGFSHVRSAVFDAPPEAVVIDCRPAAQLAGFLLRGRDAWGAAAPRLVLVGTPEEIDPEALSMPVDAVVLEPARPELLVRALAVDVARPPSGAPLQLLTRLSCLSGARDEALRQVADGVVAAFGAGAALVLAGRDEVGSTQSHSSPELDAARRRLADIALRLGATAIADMAALGARDADGAESCMAAALADADQQAVAVFAPDVRLFDATERSLLAGFGSRVGAELSWRGSLTRALRDVDALREQPRLDPALEIWNDAAFSRLVARELARRDLEGRPVSAIAIDLVGLRHINERHGHAAGDAAFRRVTDVVRLAVRQDDLIGLRNRRIVVLCADSDAEKATRVLHRVRMMLDSDPLVLRDGQELHLRVRAGIAVAPAGPDMGGDLVARASKASSEARDRDTAQVVHEEVPSSCGQPSALSESAPNIAEAITLGGTYRLLHEISSGGMGVVYRAEDLALGRAVAIKMLRPDLASDSALVDRFRAEAAILAQLRHPGLVQIYTFGVDRDDTYFAMELVEGESLESRIERCRRRGEPVPPAEVGSIVAQVADALDAIHAVGIIHRDVKPANVLIDPFRNRAVLVDVGIARRYGEEAAAAGTPGFVAPEVMLGAEASQLGDVYALAVTTYELLAVRSPWGEASSVQEIIDRQCWQGPRPIAEAVAELAPLDPLFARVFSPEPADRPPSAGAFAEELLDVLAEMGRSSLSSVTAADTLPTADTTPPGVTLGWDLGEALPSGAALVTPVSAPVPSSRGAAAPAFEPNATHTRGVVFRSVPHVLGARQADRWRRHLVLEHPRVGLALGADTAPLGWLPAGLFLELLSHPPEAMAAEAFGAALGRAAIRTSFRRFFPVSAATLVPARTLTALDVIWCRYHTWGTPKAMLMTGDQAAVTLQGMPELPAARAFVAGMLEQLVTMSRATGVTSRVVEWSPERQRGTFELAWEIERG